MDISNGAILVDGGEGSSYLPIYMILSSMLFCHFTNGTAYHLSQCLGFLLLLPKSSM